jgi:hypothetical protein
MVKETPEEGLEYIYHNGELYALILRNNFKSESITFFTPDSLSQQLGYLPHKKGNIINPHRHNINKREILYTQEVLFLKQGKVKVNFYDSNHSYVGTEIVSQGDVILLCGGGHGFEIIEDSIMIEVKQGPYVGIDDKVRFNGIERNNDTCK